MRITALLMMVLMLTGCSYFANKPLDTLHYRAPAPVAHKNLFIFMRGIGGSHRSFADEGMVDAVRERNIDFDMKAPNAHFAYYSERTLIQRLQADVIQPAMDQGYTDIWLVGVSMGGLGSMLFLKERPENIKGICLIAPFPGYADIINEINGSGGIKKWNPGPYDPEKDWERMFWHWIKDEITEHRQIPIYLGYGTDDEYHKGQALLAASLGEENVFRTTGGHDHDTFKRIWADFLDRGFYKLSGGPKSQ